jgi:hypothetical protein
MYGGCTTSQLFSGRSNETIAYTHSLINRSCFKGNQYMEKTRHSIFLFNVPDYAGEAVDMNGLCAEWL